MPIKIPSGLPAHKMLEEENIFVMDEKRALHQDIRPLKIAVLNLMPAKITTENQLIRLLSNTSLQIDLTLLQTASYTPKNTAKEHMKSFYKNVFDVKDDKFDGLIITGAPVEVLPFEDVDYWDELCFVMEWAKTNVFSTFYICWAAQAGLYYHYNIPKYERSEKLFGVFSHTIEEPMHPLVRGFDETFFAPHSRHTETRREDVEKVPGLKVLAASEEAGLYIAASDDMRRFFVTGHAEYDTDTLSLEYFRDLERGLDIAIPENYFPDNDPSKAPRNLWRAHAHLLFSNWLNYCVYQITPYDLDELETGR